MSNVMRYKNYIGSVEFSEEDMVFFGKVQGIKSLISYEGTSCKELVKNFKESIDDYLDMCKRKKMEPEVPYKGSFNVRINPNLHREASLFAYKHKMTLNSLVEESIKEKIAV